MNAMGEGLRRAPRWSPHRLGAGAKLDCEVLVVGSGAGGASVAATLTAAGCDVLMIEEGPYLDAEHLPGSLPASQAAMWRGGGLLATLGEVPVAYAEGRCVGGGTEINSAIFQRTPDVLLDEWAARHGIADYGAAALKPYFDRAARVVHASAPPADPGPPTEVLRRGGEALGWEVTALTRGMRQCVGTNQCSAGCPTGAKQSMTATLIREALAGGMRLVAQCRALRLRHRHGWASGLLASARGADGRRHRVEIRARHVFLCAGAVHSPALLRRSGIRHNVGNSLRMHPTLKATALFPEPLDAHEHRLPLAAVTEFMPELRLGGSVMLPGTLAMALAEDWAQRSWLMPEWRRCGSYYAMVRARGTGTIRTVPFASEPLVRYTLAEQDWRMLALGSQRLAEVMFAAGAQVVYPAITGHPGWRSLAELRADAPHALPRSRTNLMTIHIFSSLPPGEDRTYTATDSYGRLHALDNVVVADASQIPEAPGVNPQGTIMALAFRNAEAFLARRGEGDTAGLAGSQKEAGEAALRQGRRYADAGGCEQ